MLWFDVKTPRETMVAVLKFLDWEAGRYKRAANTATLKRDKADEMARHNAIKTAVFSLRECNIMLHNKKEERDAITAD